MIKLNQLFKNKPLIAYLLLVVSFSLLFIFVELNNEKLFTSDLKVYFEATRDFFKGNSPYVKPYGIDTGFFKYPPTTLLLFSPFVLNSFGFFQFVHLAILVVSLLIAIPLWKSLLTNQFGLTKGNALLLILSFIVIVIHVTRELHLGNINLVLLLLFIFGVYFLSKKNSLIAMVFWSLMVILKPIMILVFLPLLLWGYIKEVGYLAFFGLVYFFIPSFFFGWSDNLVLWKEWLQAISAHGEYLRSPHSLQYLIQTYVGIPHSWWPSIIGLIILITLMVVDRVKQGENFKSFFVWTVLFMAFIPNFFITDTQHFLLSIPLIMYLLYSCIQTNNLQNWLLFCVGMACFSFDSMDLWGRTLSTLIYEKGVLGIGNLIFIVSALYVWSKQKSVDAASYNL
jgi:hypothetical protein